MTLSYCAWQASDARTIGPSPLLLQALRLWRQDAILTFQDLHDTMSRVVSAIPYTGRPMLDADDVWMRALGAGDVMRRGVRAVRQSFAPLDRGLTARAVPRRGSAWADPRGPRGSS